MTLPAFAATALLLVLCPWQSGWADIYVMEGADGAILLSNVPADPRYTVLIAAPPSAPPSRESAKVGPAPASKGRYDRLVDEAARGQGLESALVHAVISVESRYDPRAVSPKGAAGLMQLMPGTARRYGAADVFDPAQNLGAGTRYLRDLWTLFGGDLELVLAAFNAGENAVLKYGGRIPPYRETQRYVPRVLDYYRRYRASAGDAPAAAPRKLHSYSAARPQNTRNPALAPRSPEPNLRAGRAADGVR